MRHARSIFTLPSALLLLLVAVPPYLIAAEPSWPYNLPPDAKYFPEDEVHVKRNAKVMKRLASQTPIGVRKMSGDEGEMFFLDYWQFHEAGLADESGGLGVADKQLLRRKTQDPEEYANASLSRAYFPPFLLHAEQLLQYEHPFRFLPRNALKERDFQCPTGTSSCAAINRPNSCCGTGETCVIVTDTGLGDVGCCPAGTSCSGSVSTCDTTNGYTSCPGSSNGGCCIPNYTCEGVGCIISGTRTVTTTLPVATSTIRPSTSPTSSLSSSTTSPSTTAPTSTPPSTTSSPTTAPVIVQSPLTCTSGFQSCPASLGGGCCPTNRACGSPSCPPLSTPSTATATASAAAPIRPTSGDDTIVPVTPSTTATTETPASAAATGSACPTGFYMCSAYYIGGCCQVGRDCARTSCPPSPGAIVVSNGVTVAAPAGATVAVASAGSGTSNGAATTGMGTTTGTTTTTAGAAQGGGRCATGWYSCAADRGGGCCPSGYGCAESCVASVSGVGSVGKQAPSSGGAGVRGWGWGFGIAGVAIGVGMLIL